MNPAAAIASALAHHIDPALAGAIGSAALIAGMFAIAGTGAWLYERYRP
ncbi:hypothetical protein [Halomonas salipaludis]|nr:hypothetical protein [Halomonas salipaludis]